MGVETLALAAIGIGTGLQISGTLRQGDIAEQQGRDAQKIAEARADIDIQNAEAARAAAVEEARIEKEKGRRLIATQKGQAAAGGIRINVGAPLVIEAQTRADITKDIGFILETGRAEEDFFRSSAALELATGRVALRQGKEAKKQSRVSALTQGLMGFGTIAMMGSTSFSKTPLTTSPARWRTSHQNSSAKQPRRSQATTRPT